MLSYRTFRIKEYDKEERGGEGEEKEKAEVKKKKLDRKKYYRTGLSNLRPTGRMRPARQCFAAREVM